MRAVIKNLERACKNSFADACLRFEDLLESWILPKKRERITAAAL